MKKTFKCGIVAAVAVAAGFAAYQSYGSYGLQDNSLLMQNIEALAENKPEPGGEPSGELDYRMTKCYKDVAAMHSTDEGYICPSGTDLPDHIKECPNETKRIDKSSNNTSYCLNKN